MKGTKNYYQPSNLEQKFATADGCENVKSCSRKRFAPSDLLSRDKQICWEFLGPNSTRHEQIRPIFSQLLIVWQTVFGTVGFLTLRSASIIGQRAKIAFFEMFSIHLRFRTSKSLLHPIHDLSTPLRSALQYEGKGAFRSFL